MLTVEDERQVEEIAARLSERKSRKIALAKYPVETLKRVKSMLVQQVPMATICKICGVPSSVVIKLQKDFNPKLRKRFHLNQSDKVYYIRQMLADHVSPEQIAKFLDLSVQGFKSWWSYRKNDTADQPTKGRPQHYTGFTYN
ncbi:MAG TPA: hypothetical protein DHV72_19090 [Serratia grimesii]|uniref:Uncharacterized protein n=1 Tax=Serratia grimesii TaxID=82995 RepID=A0A9C7QZA1_9GAMM|nr:hypothetical protein [Serratia grimesii]HCK02107.1 hypothetical protein [Serratia grimesii]